MNWWWDENQSPELQHCARLLQNGLRMLTAQKYRLVFERKRDILNVQKESSRSLLVRSLGECLSFPFPFSSHTRGLTLLQSPFLLLPTEDFTADSDNEYDFLISVLLRRKDQTPHFQDSWTIVERVIDPWTCNFSGNFWGLENIRCVKRLHHLEEHSCRSWKDFCSCCWELCPTKGAGLNVSY